MSLHKFKTLRAGQGCRLTTLTRHTHLSARCWLSSNQDTHMLTPTKAVLNVNASLLMDVSVNFSPLSLGSLHHKDAAAGAKGVPHRCVTNSGVTRTDARLTFVLAVMGPIGVVRTARPGTE